MTTISGSRQKILLINPPSEFKTPVLPLGLASIAAYLKEKNDEFGVFVIDAWAENLGPEELKNKIAKTKADIAGIYMVSPRYDQAKKTIEICRQALPKSLIIAGGPHPSAMPRETLADIPCLDICAIGEGEKIMLELANNAPIEGIKGISYRKNGDIITTPARELIGDLDSLPIPDRGLFPIEKYRTHPPYGRKKPYFTIITSRGCPFRCAYCSKDVFRQNYRAKSPGKVCDEIEELILKYGARETHFYDDDFTLDMKRAEEICNEIIRRKIKIIWSCTTRVDLVNEGLLRKMKEAGCWLISYGVESGNQKILDAINKGFTVQQIMSAFETTRKIGISTVGFFMVGLPGETEATIKETLALSKKIKPNFVSWGILVAYPGSSFYKDIQAGKYRGRLRILGRDKGENLTGTFFGKGNYIVFEDSLTFEQLRTIIKKANWEFYFRPAYLLQAVSSIRSFSDLSYYLRAAAGLIQSII